MDTEIIDKTQGYVLMWRSLMDTIIFKNENLWQVYSWCLFRANHRQVDEMPGLKKVHLNPGQFITSTRRASDALHVSVPTLYEYLSLLESEHLIERQPNTRYSVITILNWEELQHPERFSEHKLYNKLYTDNAHKAFRTLKTEDKSIEKSISFDEDSLISLSEEFQVPKAFVYSKVDDLKSYCQSTGKTYKDYYSTLRSWVKKDALTIRKEAVNGNKKHGVDYSEL